MTNGQIQRLRDLDKCWNLSRFFSTWVLGVNTIAKWDESTYQLSKREKSWLRRLTHQYRHQIKAMKRNQGMK